MCVPKKSRKPQTIFFFFFHSRDCSLFLRLPGCVLSVCAHFSVSICTTFYPLLRSSHPLLLASSASASRDGKSYRNMFQQTFLHTAKGSRRHGRVIINFRLCRAFFALLEIPPRKKPLFHGSRCFTLDDSLRSLQFSMTRSHLVEELADCRAKKRHDDRQAVNIRECV